MKKFFTFFAAALLSVSMFGTTVQEDITLDASAWWGWDSSQENVEGKLVGTITAGYGAIATSSVGEADWSGWTKLVVVVDNIVPNGDVQWWYLKAELRNPNYEYPASVTMTGELGKQGHNPAETNYVVIDLTTVPDGFDITQVDALVLQSEVAASFTVSRIFLEKEGNTEGIESVQNSEFRSQKIVVDGMLYIVRDGKMFNALGAQVK